MRPRCACGWFLKDAEPVIGYSKAEWLAGPYIAAVKGGCRRHGWVETQDCTDWDYWFAGADEMAVLSATRLRYP